MALQFLKKSITRKTHVHAQQMHVKKSLFVIASDWKESKCLPPREWLNKLIYSYAIKYYIVMKMSKLI